jgi:hypothetical protein
MEIINAIIQSASLYLNPNDSFGYGIPNFALADSILGGSSSFNTDYKPLVFPNPFVSAFDILFFEEAPQHVTVDAFDIIGRKVNSFPSTFCCGLNNLPIYFLDHVSNGIYFLRVRSDEHTDVIRVVKAEN